MKRKAKDEGDYVDNLTSHHHKDQLHNLKQSRLVFLPAELQWEIFFLSCNSNYPEVHPHIFHLLQASIRPSLQLQRRFLQKKHQKFAWNKDPLAKGISYRFFDLDTLDALMQSSILTYDYLKDVPIPKRLLCPLGNDPKQQSRRRLLRAMLDYGFSAHLHCHSPIIKAVQLGDIELCRLIFSSRPYSHFYVKRKHFMSTSFCSSFMNPRDIETRHRILPERKFTMTIDEVQELENRILQCTIARKNMEMLKFLFDEVKFGNLPQFSITSLPSYEHLAWSKCGSEPLARAARLEWWEGVAYLRSMGVIPDMETLNLL